MALASTRAAPTPSQGASAEKRGVPRGALIAGGVGLGAVLLTLIAVHARAQARDEALARGEVPPPDDGFLGTLTNLLAPPEDPLAGAGGALPGGDGENGGAGPGGGDRDGDGDDDGAQGEDDVTPDPDGEDEYEYACPPGYTLDASRLVCVPQGTGEGGAPQPPTCPPGYAWDGVTCRLVGPGGGGGDTTTSGPGDEEGDDEDGFDWAPLFGAGLAGAGLAVALNDKTKGKGDDGRGPRPEEPEAPRRGPEEPRRPPPDETPRGEPERARTSGVNEPRPPGETPGARGAESPRSASDPFAPRGVGDEEPGRRTADVERTPRRGTVETPTRSGSTVLQLDAPPSVETAPSSTRTAPVAEPSAHVAGPRPAGEASALARGRNLARGAGRAALLAGDLLFLYEGGVTVAEGAPSIAQGAKAILTGPENITPEEARRIRDDTAKTAKQGSSLLSLGFAEIDLADRDKTQRSPLKVGIPDWLGLSGSETGNFVRANVGLNPKGLLGFIPTPTVSLEENRLPAPAQFAEGAKTLIKSDNLAQKAVGVAVAPAAIVAEATTIPPSQFLSGAQNLANAAGQKASEAGAAVSGAAAYGYEKTGLGSVGGFFTAHGLNPFASPAPAAPPPVTPSFASQEKNDRDTAIFYAKQGKSLPSNLAKYEPEVASYRPAPEPVVYGPPPPPPAAPAPLTELQRRILSGTEPRPATTAAPQPVLGPNNSAASPGGSISGLTYEQRRLLSDIPAPAPAPAPTPPAPAATPAPVARPPAKTDLERLAERLRKKGLI